MEKYLNEVREYIQENKIKELMDKIYASTDELLLTALSQILKENENIKNFFATRIDFLNNENCSFEEHLQNLKKKFPEYKWDILADVKSFQMARFVKEMINFELIKIAEKGKQEIKPETEIIKSKKVEKKSSKQKSLHNPLG